ncbi:class I tRNA ligase family protein [Nocardia asteroides]|uniref:class I tRNA ligase family protein n=1 Tax=Nocardia asteroides TaxID=1824 RepID=UPI0037CCA098
MTRWLLTPMQPTPNGRLHLGHGAGPYLRADVIARMLRSQGHDAEIITGSDAYENWVLADSLTSGRTAHQTCDHFHTGIAEDLAYMGVELAEWINPLAPEHRDAYIRTQEDLLRDVTGRGVAVLTDEQVPIGERSGTALVGVWIAGNCPSCGKAAGGNSCTFCSDSFHPSQLLDPHSRLSDEPIRWEVRKNWLAPAQSPHAVLQGLAGAGVSSQAMEPVHKWLGREDPSIRLSLPGTWGVHSDLAPDGAVLSNTYYGYTLYCGDRHAARHDGANPFSPESGVRTIGLFGTDNSIAGMAAPWVLTEGSKAYRPFDRTVVNSMLHWAGRKLSTSQNYGLWIGDLAEGSDITSDELRFVLSSIPLDQEVSSVDAHMIADTVNSLRKWRNGSLREALEKCASSSARLGHTQELERALEIQHRWLSPPTFDLALAHRELQYWMSVPAGVRPPDWLVGVSLLAWPIMPVLSQQVWTALGLHGAPMVSALDAQPRLQVDSRRFDPQPHGVVTPGQIDKLARQ